MRLYKRLFGLSTLTVLLVASLISDEWVGKNLVVICMVFALNDSRGHFKLQGAKDLFFKSLIFFKRFITLSLLVSLTFLKINVKQKKGYY